MSEENAKMSKNMGSGRWFVCDPCGITCAVVTYMLVLYGEFVVLFILSPPFPSTGTCINVVVFTALGLLAVVSHLKAMLTDPGVVPHESASEEDVLQRRQQGEDIKYCKKCRSIKPERAHHCSTCERCIHKMDHHCPWVNNCVGENNQKYFVLFTFYIMVLSIYGLLMVAWFFFCCVQQNFEGCDSILPGPLVFILTIFGVFEGLLFSLFTCIMFCTQIHSIATDETGIESLKKETRQKKSMCESFTDVFGSPPSFKWLSPFTPPPKATKKFQLTSVCTSV